MSWAIQLDLSENPYYEKGVTEKEKYQKSKKLRFNENIKVQKRDEGDPVKSSTYLTPSLHAHIS